MKPKEVLKIGDSVEIEIVTKGEYQGSYLSKLQDVEEDVKVFIGLPMEKGNVVPLRVGQYININITRKDAVYTFGGDIKFRAMTPYPHFIMEYPKTLRRLQRRNYVRVTINLIVNYKIGKKKEEEEDIVDRAVSINLSGGGIYFIANRNIEMGEKMKINFTLPNGMACNEITGIVKRKEITGEKGREKLGVGLEFEEISEKVRDQIILYLFELQRDRKSKGVDL